MMVTVRAMVRKSIICCAGLLLLLGFSYLHGEEASPRPAPPQKNPAAPVDASPSWGSNAELRDELRAMAKADENATGGNVRVDNAARLKEIIREYGWPGNSLVGRHGARAAWLIAQHADFDLPFQQQCLKLIEGAHLLGDVDGHDLAYLTDRVAEAERKPQVYGTQGSRAAFTPEEEAVIDERRRAVGLPTLSEFQAMCAKGEYRKIHDPGW